jgi:hypothetical protein
VVGNKDEGITTINGGATELKSLSIFVAQKRLQFCEVVLQSDRANGDCRAVLIHVFEGPTLYRPALPSALELLCHLTDDVARELDISLPVGHQR